MVQALSVSSNDKFYNKLLYNKKSYKKICKLILTNNKFYNMPFEINNLKIGFTTNFYNKI